MPCPFCQLERPIIQENDHAFAILDGYPVSQGHSLIIPRRHVKSYFELDKEEQEHCWALVNAVREELSEKGEPDGFNIGINDGKLAGQTIMHTHIHLIPRFKGDIDDPTGGVRQLIPGKGSYNDPGGRQS